MRNGADIIIRAFKEALSLWQEDIKLLNGTHRFEAISINGHVMLVQQYPRGEGFEVFAPVTDEGRIGEVLQAIAKRCNVKVQTDDSAVQS